MTGADWLALAAIFIPLVIKTWSDCLTNDHAVHNQALARLVGMAGREAATIARALADRPPGSDLESVLVETAVRAISQEMAASIAVTGASTERVSALVQGELDKLLRERPPKPPAPAPIPVMSAHLG